MTTISNAEEQAKWYRIAGYWTVQDSLLTENRGRSSIWGYHELMNYNTLVTVDSYPQYTNYSADIKIFNVKRTPVEILFAFLVNSPHLHYYYNFYAFKLTGSAEKITRISLIQSQRKNDALPFNAKFNYTIKELQGVDYSLNYNEKHAIKITFDEKKATLNINGKPVISFELPVENMEGRFAISNRNASIQIDKITIKNGKEILFTDDFNYDSIKVFKVKAVKTNNPQ
ncbi:MAG: hypothetical protein CVV44_15355 [Spirochaetae bacterium HGW-Spirochaetae-1]|nr:MAG: hypothetical protein CVV44_15355 [Spirochaetae bacterium HGW-Spirochaetae-1]